jgi:hypothetical protein
MLKQQRKFAPVDRKQISTATKWDDRRDKKKRDMDGGVVRRGGKKQKTQEQEKQV